MKRYLIVAFIMLLQISFSQKNWELIGDDLIVDGKKIGSIVEDKLNKGTYKKLLVKDVNGITRFIESPNDFKLYFADDYQSHVTGHWYSNGIIAKKQLARFFSEQDILTPTGYDSTLKVKFIQKNYGILCDKSGRILSTEMRDTSKTIWLQTDITVVGGYSKYYVIENGFIIGDVYEDANGEYSIANMYGGSFQNKDGDTSSKIHSNYIGYARIVTPFLLGMDGTIYSAGKPPKELKKLWDPTRKPLEMLKVCLEEMNRMGMFDQKSENYLQEHPENGKSSGPIATKIISTPANNNKNSNSSIPPTNTNSTTSSPSGFTTYSTKSNEKLEAMKKDAVAKNDFDAAAAIKTELDMRKVEQEKVANFQKDLDEKVKAEDYAGASKLQKEIGPLKEKVAKKDQLRKDIDTAVASQDYEKAEKLKQELKALY